MAGFRGILAGLVISSSIVAHPGLPTMKDTLNARIKQREWFRPFAPSILAGCNGDSTGRKSNGR